MVKAVLLSAAGLLVAVGVLAMRPIDRPAAARVKVGAVPTDLGAAPDFELFDELGRTVRRDELGGPWIGSFMFTSCSGFCPMMARRMDAVAETLPGVRLVSFSVDGNDSPADLAKFKKAYGADWLFLTGRGDTVRRLCRDGFKLAVADGGPKEEPILHSGHVVLVDGAGRIRGYYDSSDEAALERLSREARALTVPAS